jgi:hypothetical protein
MPKWDWRISFATSTTFTTLPSVENISISNGRRRQIDDYGVDTLTVESLFPSSWTVAPKLGDKIIAWVYTTAYPSYPTYNYWKMFQGRIVDVNIKYGMVTNEDSVTITAEGLQADLGRTQINGYAVSSGLTDLQVFDTAASVGVVVGGVGSMSTGSAQTYTGNLKAFVDNEVRTEQGRLRSTPSAPNVLEMGQLDFVGRSSLFFGLASAQEWSDGTLAPAAYSAYKYQEIKFKSASEDYYNSVTVEPLGLASQTSTAGVTPIFSYVANTYDVSTSQASSLAQYIRFKYDTTASSPRELGFTIGQQSSADAVWFLNLVSNFLGLEIQVVLRGARYYCVVEGVNINATPDETRIVFSVSSNETNDYLLLDDTIYGRLDFNRLGF